MFLTLVNASKQFWLSLLFTHLFLGFSVTGLQSVIWHNWCLTYLFPSSLILIWPKRYPIYRTNRILLSFYLLVTWIKGACGHMGYMARNKPIFWLSNQWWYRLVYASIQSNQRAFKVVFGVATDLKKLNVDTNAYIGVLTCAGWSKPLHAAKCNKKFSLDLDRHEPIIDQVSLHICILYN